MYKDILVPVDNSEWSDYAVEAAMELARRFGATLTGSHIYAARLHDTRFRQMEPGLPERYQTEDILTKQREIHDSLIGKGLGMISESYLDAVERRCAEAGVAFRRHTAEGRNYEKVIGVARAGQFDLVVMGAHGLGKCARALVGSVCERTVRGLEVDALVMREPARWAAARIVVGVDGSDASMAAARRAIKLAKACDGSVTALAAYDPFYHRVAFQSIATVLSAEAAKVFRFREQEALHDEIIDRGLMALYQSHLDRVAGLAEMEAVPLETHVLEGKPYDAVLSFAQEAKPALLVMGRRGMHSHDGGGLGSNTENALRLAACNLLVVAERSGDQRALAEDDSAEAEAPPLPWTAEAEQRLERIPPFARGMARRGIEDYAREHGYPIVDPSVVAEAKSRFGM